ncbi:MAG: IclR family transcriptional regulator [Cyclobacteriaceae bacterium]
MSQLKSNFSAVKVLQIIENMAAEASPMRVKDMADKLFMPTATILRFLKTLMEAGYVSKDPVSNRYFLTYKILKVGEQVRNNTNLREVIRPYLVELTSLVGESGCLAIEVEQMAVYIDVVEGPDRMLRTLQRIGRSAPLHSTGVGKNLLLNYSEKAVSQLVKEKGLPQLTPNTITNLDKLLELLQIVKQDGVAYDNEECEIGVKCIAAPVFNFENKVIASISISAPTARLQGNYEGNVINHLKSTAAKISSIFTG